MEYREQVKKTVFVAALTVTPKKAVGDVLKRLRGTLFSHRGVRNVVDSPNDADTKLLLLDPALVPPSTSAWDQLPPAITDRLALCETTITFSVVSQHRVELTYLNFTMPELLKMVLPEGVIAISGFEQVGHIAHVNLSDNHLPFQRVIGQVILDTNNTVKTVVNKVDSISSEFREFKMEVIAGVPELNATVRQHGLTFHVPYDKVYWNSRLGEEHERLVKQISPFDELFDVMAGIGPFAIPAAVKGVKVYANDLNPASYEAMKRNVAANFVDASKVETFNMDGRDFIEKVLREQHLEKSVLPRNGRRHVSMNLPALAVQFLDTFTRDTWRTGKVVDETVLIHCYTFSAAKEDFEGDAVRQIEQVLGCSLEGCVEQNTNVRDVAPMKQMMCVSFHLPKRIFSGPVKRARSEEEARSDATTQ